MKTIEVKKGKILRYEGDPNKNFYEVKSGLLRSYSIDAKGKEHIFMFAPESWTVGEGVEFGTPCELYVDALEDSTLQIREMDYQNFNLPMTLRLLKRMTVLQKRVIMLMSSSALERYEEFLTTYPNIVERVPQRMIASYLGITPEALSKVKSERYKQGSKFK